MAIAYSVNSSAPECPTQLDGTRLETAVPPPRRWTGHRPGEIAGPQPAGPMLGAPAPDAGYAFLLFERLRRRLIAFAYEDVADVRTAITATALRRASHLGRAPAKCDLEWAAKYWGMVGEDGSLDESPPSGMTPKERAKLFAGCSHDFARQRIIAAHPAEDLFGR